VAVAEAAASAYLSAMRSSTFSRVVPAAYLPPWLRSTRALERFRNEVRVGSGHSDTAIHCKWIGQTPHTAIHCKWIGQTPHTAIHCKWIGQTPLVQSALSGPS
jgi:hypothetical protein